MFDSHEKVTGTQYSTSAALIVLAFLVSPAILILSRPLGYLSVSLALALSIMCITLSWLTWKKYSQLTVPSLESSRARSN